MKENFIRTSDEETKKQLEYMFHLVNYDGKYWTFINDPTIKFSKNVDNLKINYTNKLCI
jgi:hypothetical protein